MGILYHFFWFRAPAAPRVLKHTLFYSARTMRVPLLTARGFLTFAIKGLVGLVMFIIFVLKYGALAHAARAASPRRA